MPLSNLTKYCPCHEKWLSGTNLFTHETLFTMRGATDATVEPHQILRLPRKITFPNQRKIWWKQMKCHFQCATDPTMIRQWNRQPQPASQLRLLFALTSSILYWKIPPFTLRLSFQISPNTAPATKRDTATSPNTAPATQSDSHDQTSSHMKCYLQCAEQQMPPSNLTKYCACRAKWLSWSNLFTHETLFTMRGATDAIVEPHQILRLPRKMTLMIKPLHTWNAISNARSNRCYYPTSPNTAPATKNHRPKSERNLVKTDETSFPMRGRSDHDPRMKPSARNPPRNRGYFSRGSATFCIEKYNISRSGYPSQFHQILHLPRKMTLQDHQILHLPRKMTLVIDPCHIWNVIYNAQSSRCHPPTSPNIAPATKNHHRKSKRTLAKTDETSQHGPLSYNCS